MTFPIWTENDYGEGILPLVDSVRTGAGAGRVAEWELARGVVGC